MSRTLVFIPAVAICIGMALSVHAGDKFPGPSPTAQKRSSAQAEPPRVSMVRTPLSFEPNRGQNGSSAAFLAHGPGYSLELEPKRARLRLGGEKDRAITLGFVNANADAPIRGEDLLP